MTSSATPSQVNFADIDNFISGMISHLEADKFMFQNNIATKENSDFYKTMVYGDIDEMSNYGRVMSSIHFTKKIVEEFLLGLKNQDVNFSKLGFSLYNHKVNVWAQINDDDDKSENALYLLESSINARFEKYSLGLSLIIVEDCDNLPIPNKYKEIPNLLSILSKN